MMPHALVVGVFLFKGGARFTNCVIIGHYWSLFFLFKGGARFTNCVIIGHYWSLFFLFKDGARFTNCVIIGHYFSYLRVVHVSPIVSYCWLWYTYRIVFMGIPNQ
jgi:glycerol-3-phosphate acyltransferase PlsY